VCVCVCLCVFVCVCVCLCVFAGRSRQEQARGRVQTFFGLSTSCVLLCCFLCMFWWCVSYCMASMPYGFVGSHVEDVIVPQRVSSAI
jgi:hypothetical protein